MDMKPFFATAGLVAFLSTAAGAQPSRVEVTGGDADVHLKARVVKGEECQPARPNKNGKVKKILKGLGKVVEVAGETTFAVAGYVIEGYIEGLQSGGSGCVHGYSHSTCPFGSNGTSYGSSYLSGPGHYRARPDGFGGYRYYGADGQSGRMQPTYGGGYRVTTSDGRTALSYSSRPRSAWSAGTGAAGHAAAASSCRRR